ncbi:MAG: hypothetical protein HGA79_04965, partial [Anaerolineales bacterium]|nr:hypothetical protein [Anaerolineales bacterium]
VILAGIPFFVANLPIKLTFPFDRFTQPFALGTALLLAAGLELIPRPTWRAVVTGSLAALAVGVQIQNAFAFREDWRLQESYFWQLAWRAPGLKPGTVIVSEKSPFRFTDDEYKNDFRLWPQNSVGFSAMRRLCPSFRQAFEGSLAWQ